jgi:hypothetical protein
MRARQRLRPFSSERWNPYSGSNFSPLVSAGLVLRVALRLARMAHRAAAYFANCTTCSCWLPRFTSRTLCLSTPPKNCAIASYSKLACGSLNKLTARRYGARHKSKTMPLNHLLCLNEAAGLWGNWSAGAKFFRPIERVILSAAMAFHLGS